jgi:hypothetical protein
MPNLIMEELRGQLDGQDPFMTGGHQVIRPRRSDRRTPDWATTNKKIRAILLRSFPKLKTHPVQRIRAGRWAQIIQLYYRAHLSKKQIAEQLKLSYNAVRMIVRNINRAANGKKANGIANTNRPNGRPKGKASDTRATPLGRGKSPEGSSR